MIVYHNFSYGWLYHETLQNVVFLTVSVGQEFGGDFTE